MILTEITRSVTARLAEDQRHVSLADMKAAALARPAPEEFPFERALAGRSMSFICEVKKASPSKGVIVTDFPYVDIAREYEAAGAAAISCLTERDYFQGHVRYLKDISRAVTVPVLRKDFIVSPYQIYEARACGAAAILLICAILTDEQLAAYFTLADSLGLSVLVEAHDAGEVRRARQCGARVIGVNNRNLKDFTVSLDTSCHLRELVPPEVLFVAESGIRTRDHVARLEAHGVDAVLIGETLMRAADKRQMMATLAGDRP